MATFLTILGMLVSVMLIGIILLQRGRGGGLVGALSGLGGQSAFGTKAGDMFTRITIGIAAVWVLLAGISGQVLRARTSKFQGDEPSKFSSTDSGTEKSKSAAGKKDDDELPMMKIDDLLGESKSSDPAENVDDSEKPAGKAKSDDAADEPASSKKKLNDDEKPDAAKPSVEDKAKESAPKTDEKPPAEKQDK